jgi:starch synthase
VPIVRATGGLIDTVQEFDPKAKKGNGFVFEQYNANEMLESIHRALNTYKDKDLWNTVVRNGMNEDHSWNYSSKKYEEIYRKLLMPS